MKTFVFTISLALVLAITLPNHLDADYTDYFEHPEHWNRKGDYMVLANIYATKYGVPIRKAKATLKCESNFNNNAVGDGGKAKTLAQFHEPTFIELAEEYRKETGEILVYGKAFDAIKLFNWAISKGYGEKWTCWK